MSPDLSQASRRDEANRILKSRPNALTVRDEDTSRFVQLLYDEEPLVRQAAIRLLSGKVDARIYSIILDMLVDEDANVRHEALQVILRSNPSQIDSLYDAATREAIEDEERRELLAKIASFGPLGEEYLLKILGSSNAGSAKMAAERLASAYPYPNAGLTQLMQSHTANSRRMAALWLSKYNNVNSLEALLRMFDEADASVRAQAAEAYWAMGSFVLEPTIRYVQNGLFRSAREAMILYLANAEANEAMPFLGELLASQDEETRRRGRLRALAYGDRFLPFLQEIFRASSANARLEALSIASEYSNAATAEQAIPLLNDANAHVRAAAQAYLAAAYDYAEEALNASFDPKRQSFANSFIVRLLTERGSVLLLYEPSQPAGSLSYARLTYLFSNLSLTAWQLYVGRLKGAVLKLDLAALRNIYDIAAGFQKERAALQGNSLIRAAQEAVRLAIQTEQAMLNDQAALNSSLARGSVPSAAANGQSRRLRQESSAKLAAWRQQAAEAGLQEKNGYAGYYNYIQRLYDAYMSVKAENRSVADQFLLAASSSSAFLRIFLTSGLNP